MDFKKICIIGLGYIGLPTASMFATTGIHVRGVDTNLEIINTLKTGNIHIHEPGLREIVTKAFNEGMLVVENKPDLADAFIIAVPTPFLADKKADMSFVISAAESILPYLREGNLVVLESTSPVRTTVDLIVPILEKSGLKAGEEFLVAYSPERVLPGQILQELVENARVIGGITPESAQAGKDLYRAFVKGEIILTDSTTAEMVKLMENTYRDVNIAIANEFSRLADRFGVDIREAITIANLHPRVKILNPGPGVGGHCISVDPWFFVEEAPDLAKLIHTARLVNDSQQDFVLSLVERILGSLTGKKIGILGLSYKPDVDDIRESPAIEIARLLVSKGAQVNAYEPFLKKEIDGINTVPGIIDATKDSDLILVLVAHTQFRNLDVSKVSQNNKHLILDTVDIIPATWEQSGYKIYHLGNGHEWNR